MSSKNKKRKTVTKAVGNAKLIDGVVMIKQRIQLDKFPITVDDLIKKLETAKEKYSAEYEDLYIDKYWDNYTDTVLAVFGTRLETDLEYEDRIEKKARYKAYVKKLRAEEEQQELKEFQRLLKKFKKTISNEAANG